MLAAAFTPDEEKPEATRVVASDDGSTTEAPNEPTSTSEAAETTAAPTTTTEAATTTTTEATTTTVPPTPGEAYEAAIRDELGSSNRDVDPRVTDFVYNESAGGIVITFALDDNLTAGMIRSGMRIDITDILRVTRGSRIDYAQITIEGTFLLVDQLGNTSEERVVLAHYLRLTVDQINFDNFIFDNVLEPALTDGDAFIHPAMRE